MIDTGGMILEDGSFVNRPDDDGDNGDEADEEGGPKKRSTVITNERGEAGLGSGVEAPQEPAMEGKRSSVFDAANLKGRPLL